MKNAKNSNLNRRSFIRCLGSVLILSSCSLLMQNNSLARNTIKRSPNAVHLGKSKNKINKDKVMGAYIGAAIGDAMGGPVECSHYKRIKHLVGEINRLLPYDRKYSFHDPQVDGPMTKNIEPEDDSDRSYISSFYAEQVPFAIAGFVFRKGDPEISIPTTVMIGRDCDSTAPTTGSWVGAIHGESGLPKDWVDTVCSANINEIDIRGLANKLYKIIK